MHAAQKSVALLVHFDTAFACTMQVVSVTANETGEPVKFAYTTVLMTEEYSVA